VSLRFAWPGCPGCGPGTLECSSALQGLVPGVLAWYLGVSLRFAGPGCPGCGPDTLEYQSALGAWDAGLVRWIVTLLRWVWEPLMPLTSALPVRCHASHAQSRRCRSGHGVGLAARALPLAMSLTDRSPVQSEGDRSVGLGSPRQLEPLIATPPRLLRYRRVLAATLRSRLRVTAATAPGRRPGHLLPGTGESLTLGRPAHALGGPSLCGARLA
jgi:hypothetical protein